MKSALGPRIGATNARSTLLIITACAAGWSSAFAQAVPTSSSVTTICQNMAANAHECGRQAREAAKLATSTEELMKIGAAWDARFKKSINGLRESKVGLTRAKSDMELIEEALYDEVDGALKDPVREAAAKKLTPALWKFWSTRMKWVSRFMDSPLTKGLSTFLKPSETATDYDALLATNNGVNQALYDRGKVLVPPPTLVESVEAAAYEMANQKLGQRFRPAPSMSRP